MNSQLCALALSALIIGSMSVAFTDNASAQPTSARGSLFNQSGDAVGMVTFTQVGSGNWIYVPSPTVVNSLHVGYSHYYQDFRSNDATQDPNNYSFNGSTYHLNTGQSNPVFSFFLEPTVLEEWDHQDELCDDLIDVSATGDLAD